jgi:hypothetical protein
MVGEDGVLFSFNQATGFFLLSIASDIVSSLEHLAFLSVLANSMLTVFHAILPEEINS